MADGVTNEFRARMAGHDHRVTVQHAIIFRCAAPQQGAVPTRRPFIRKQRASRGGMNPIARDEQPPLHPGRLPLGRAVHKLRANTALLHVEFREPSPPKGEDQDRGNSGVFLMGLYEIQVLDSYNSKTYADGQAGAVYGQYPPLVNASRAPGEWQTYDIVWHGPRFDGSGKLNRPAHVTVILNGVLVQDNVELTGPTGHHVRPPYTAGPDKLPLALQDHNHPVRYRNIWIRDLRPS